MAASPVISAPPISPGEMQLLLSRAGLVLNPGQVADLVLAWRQVAGLIASIPHDRPLADDTAYAFHLPLPAGMAAAAPTKASAPASRPAAAKAAAKPAAKARAKAKAKAAAPRTRPAAKPKAKAKAQPKAAPKRKAAKPAGRKSARRGR